VIKFPSIKDLKLYHKYHIYKIDKVIIQFVININYVHNNLLSCVIVFIDRVLNIKTMHLSKHHNVLQTLFSIIILKFILNFQLD